MEIEICKPCKQINKCKEETCTVKLYKTKFILGFCSKHSKYCIEQNCKIVATFNLEGEKKGLYCFKHKKINMQAVNRELCIFEDCKIRPSFNYKEESKALYCSKHKKSDMIWINNIKYCIESDCKISASYNFKNKQSLYCATHRKPGMSCVKVKSCIEETCEKQPCFNYKGEKKGLYCSEHKLSEMFDIKHKLCIELNCNIQANYNFKEEKYPLYCSNHSKNGMIGLKYKLCENENCLINGNKKYNGYCVFCFIHLFPDRPVTRNYKTKEKAIGDYIKEQFLDFTWITDKRTLDGCSKRRPDLLLDLGYQVIIIEIDENQHDRYEEICENKRIMELSQDLQFRPIIFIRFNPDDYTIHNKKITSCWAPNGKGILCIKKSKQKEWNERLEILKKEIEYWLNPTNISDKTIHTIKLFYDV